MANRAFLLSSTTGLTQPPSSPPAERSELNSTTGRPGAYSTPTGHRRQPGRAGRSTKRSFSFARFPPKFPSKLKHTSAPRAAGLAGIDGSPAKSTHPPALPPAGNPNPIPRVSCRCGTGAPSISSTHAPILHRLPPPPRPAALATPAGSLLDSSGSHRARRPKAAKVSSFHARPSSEDRQAGRQAPLKSCGAYHPDAAALQ